jgi:hypothetical protein
VVQVLPVLSVFLVLLVVLVLPRMSAGETHCSHDAGQLASSDWFESHPRRLQIRWRVPTHRMLR